MPSSASVILRRCPHLSYRIGVPEAGWYRELFNTDAALYGGSNTGNSGGVASTQSPCHGYAHSLSLTLPPLSVLYLKRQP